MSTIKQLLSSEYIARGPYKEYENQIISNITFHKIMNIINKGFKFLEMGKGFLVMVNTKTGKAITVYFTY